MIPDFFNAQNYLNTVFQPMAKELPDMNISYVAAVVITGLSVVFLSLVILILFINLLGIFFKRKKKDNNKTSSAMKEQVSAKVETVKSNVSAEKTAAASDDNDEIIAVISAAISALGDADGKTYKVKSVRAVSSKPSRSSWAMAGLQNNTAPF